MPFVRVAGAGRQAVAIVDERAGVAFSIWRSRIRPPRHAQLIVEPPPIAWYQRTGGVSQRAMLPTMLNTSPSAPRISACFMGCDGARRAVSQQPKVAKMATWTSDTA